MKRSKAWIVGVGILVVGMLAVLAVWMGDRHLKDRGHPGIKRFAGQLVRNYPDGFRIEPPVLQIHVKPHDLEALQRTVDAARERGVILPEDRTTVNGTLLFNGQQSDVRLRIKGKMTDHVKGSKWSFRVEARRDGGFLGMQRFSLQHPGTRNYLNEWLHHRLMAGEGIIALRYDFVQLRFNEEDLGIYAYEEHFGPELLEHNGRMEGPLFRFDPSLFWEHRLNGLHKLRFDEAYAAYQAAAIDAFGTKDMRKDSLARARFEEAVALLDGVRRGELRVAQVFDVDRLARRHALLDLVGGHHSLDWSDVKFYYDPVRQRIEPVAYESFSAFKIQQVAGAWRFEGRQRESQELHDVYFNDEEFFRAYIHQLERMSRPAYLDSVFQVLGPGLDSAAATIYREFPWKELDRSIHDHNQRVIRRVLDTPKGFHAYDHGLHGDTVRILAVPVEALPTEVHGLRLLDGTLVPPVGSTIVPSRVRGRVGGPLLLEFVVADPAQLPPHGDRLIEYSILGASTRRSLDVFAYSLIDADALDAYRHAAGTRWEDHPFVQVDMADSTIHLLPGRWQLRTDLVIPAGFTVRGTAPLDIDLVQGARIISASPFDLVGTREMPVRIGSSDRSGGGVLVHTTLHSSTWRHVYSNGFGPSRRSIASITFHHTRAQLHDLQLQEDKQRDLLALIGSRVEMNGCTIAGGQDQLFLAYGVAQINGLELYGAADDAITVRGGEVRIKDGEVNTTAGIGLKAVAGARIIAERLAITVEGDGVDLAEGSELELRDARIEAGAYAFDVDKAHGRYGPVHARWTSVSLKGGKGPVRDKGGNVLEQDGRSWTAPAP